MKLLLTYNLNHSSSVYETKSSQERPVVASYGYHSATPYLAEKEG